MQHKTVRFWGGRLILAVAASLLVLLGSAVPARAQVDTGSILGTVTDASGAAVSGASVTMTNEGTGAELTMPTGSDGTYRFTPVRIGSYKLTVTLAGFQTNTQRGVAVSVGENVVADFSLKTGSVSETVEVTSTAPVLQSQDASVGQVIDSKHVNDLPLNGRNFTFLAQLAAGVNSPQADTRGNAASGAFSANGNRPAQNNYLLDGIDNNSDTVDFLNGTNFVVLPPVDAIAEFKVQTSGFSAEYGRSGAAVLNATIKSGTNELHGAVWEFLRNDKFDAADFFENANRGKKGAYRQNQFGIAAGGPVIKNKIFFFADYEGLRRRQGTPLSVAVPTAAERTINSAGFVDLSDLINGQSGTQFDALNRSMPTGTVLDPATTRQVVAGGTDPVTGLPVPTTDHNGNPITPGTKEFVRDPFGTCSANTMAFTLGGCGLNQIPGARVDANALALLNLYPSPTTAGITNNYTNSPKLKEDRNAFDARMDFNFNSANQLFFRFSLVDDPELIPSVFGGVADGGGFFQGNQTANSQQSALGYTHTFSPTLINVARAGLSYLHTTRVSPEANSTTDFPSQYDIFVPQQAENGGLPAFGINGLQTLGSNAFLPSDEVSSTFQLTDDVTKVYGKHTFKMGFEWQHVKFSTLQPPWSRGEFDFGGTYTDVPGSTSSNTGIAQFLLIPQANSLGTGGPFIDYTGGPNQIYLSNISLTDNGKNYYGIYGNDDWRITNKLTLNLGLRWDYFQPVYEHHGNQANFIPGGGPTGGPAYLLPNTSSLSQLSTSFTTLLAQDGIALVAGQNGKSLVEGQKNNFAPRFGFAYQATPKLVARGGFGMFYNGFENRGFSPNLGESYPFQFNFSFPAPNSALPIPNYAGCTATTPSGAPAVSAGGTPILETGFACTPLDPTVVNARGLALRGIQFDYKTPYSMSGNLTLQYQLTPSMSVQVGYVTSLARHLEVFPGNNNPISVLAQSTNLTKYSLTDPTVGQCPGLGFLGNACIPFPDFGRNSSQAQTEGSSYYHGLQTRVEKQFQGGLSFLATYTWSKTMSDATDLLNGGSDHIGYRASAVPGFGIQQDYKIASFDIRNVFHLSGAYELPFGRGRKFFSQAGGVANQVIGGWQVLWIATLQDGQPITLSCPSGTAAGLGCGALFTGQPLKLGLHNDANGKLSWFGNSAAFTQPCILGGSGPTNCVSLTGTDALGGVTQVPGPGFHRLDFSIFKDFPIKERFRLQFRSEIFNIFNHPNFNAPGFGGNGVVSISGSTNFISGSDSRFGEIGSTRDNPNDPRQIQFALKFYY